MDNKNSQAMKNPIWVETATQVLGIDPDNNEESTRRIDELTLAFFDKGLSLVAIAESHALQISEGGLDPSTYPGSFLNAILIGYTIGKEQGLKAGKEKPLTSESTDPSVDPVRG